MKWQTLYSLTFSPSGTTKKVTDRVCAGLGGEWKHCDLLRDPASAEMEFSPEKLVVVGLPVFSGRLPEPCTELLRDMEGAGAPAVALVIYGNREYEDALLELTTLLTGQGFHVIAAAAFVAQHSIFPAVAAGRPDEADLAKADEFAAACRAKLAGDPLPPPPQGIGGGSPYREVRKLPLKPSADRRCNGCGLCALVCPVHAISRETPRKTDKRVCISCTACIAACPQHARRFRGPLYPLAARAFQAKCAARREPELFL